MSKEQLPENYTFDGPLMCGVGLMGPSGQLLNAIRRNDLKFFRWLLEDSLRGRYANSETGERAPLDPSALLHACCEPPDRPDFVAELLSAGADANRRDGERDRAPIHLAAANGCEGALRVLLAHPGTDVDAADRDGNTALHLAAAAGRVECSALLLRSGAADPNRPNDAGTVPAWVAVTLEGSHVDLTRSFLRCPRVDWDTVVRGESLMHVVAEKHPQFMAFKFLYGNDEDGFVSHVAATRQLDGDDGQHTYLQYACDYGLPKVARALLALGADPNGVSRTNAKRPIFIACYRGYAAVVTEFLNARGCSDCYQSDAGNVLHEVIKGSTVKHDDDDDEYIANGGRESRDHGRSWDLLLRARRETNRLFDVNAAIDDGMGNTCLHLAAKSGNAKIVHDLLDAGAYLSKSNRIGQTPLADIGRGVLESYLNKCVRTSDVSRNDEDYKIVCSYEFLCPPRVFRDDGGDDARTRLEGQHATVEDVPETGPVLYMCDVPELRPLLVHPAINGFLLQKWTRIRTIYYVNQSLYAGFLVLLTWYVLTTFQSAAAVPPTDDRGESNRLHWLWIAVWASVAVLAVRASCQVVWSPAGFASSAENWLESAAICLSACLLCERATERYRVPLSAVVVLMSWGKFVCATGRHPRFAVQWEMFKIVSKNLVFFLRWYALFLVTFVLCFHVLFRDADDDTDNAFNGIFRACFKICVMLTGELDKSHLETDTVVKKSLLALFAFFVPVVLANLLTGLAASDTREIKDRAELVAQASRVKFVHSVESTVLRDRRTGAGRFRFDLHAVISSFFVRRSGLRLMLFSDTLKVSEIAILPNRGNAIEFASSSGTSQSHYSCVAKCQRRYVDDDGVRRAKAIVKLNSEQPEKHYAGTLVAFGNKCVEIENAIKEIGEQLHAMNS